MKTAFGAFLATVMVAATALAGDLTLVGDLPANQSVTRTVGLQKGTTSIQITADHDNRLSCDFIDVDGGNVVVLSQKNVQSCIGNSVNYSSVKMAVRITNPNQNLISYEMRTRLDK